jgi:hypothetical protein
VEVSSYCALLYGRDDLTSLSVTAFLLQFLNPFRYKCSQALWTSSSCRCCNRTACSRILALCLAAWIACR